ncbi:LOW QUALITY PROTEIN: NACHT, LRR and PYD domains-containing protein 12-like [Gastrophryne carolinensis]
MPLQGYPRGSPRSNKTYIRLLARLGPEIQHMECTTLALMSNGGFAWFCHWLSGLEDLKLGSLCKYFRDDLIFIVESLNEVRLLAELSSRTSLKLEDYKSMKRDLGASAFAARLVQDVLCAGRQVVVAFWESLYTINQNATCPHPNLSAVLDEITNMGNNLLRLILEGEHGQQLAPEVKDIQNIHKNHLMGKTENLIEKKPPGSTLDEKSFYISERFVNLVVVSHHQFRKRSNNELVEMGIRHEECLHEATAVQEHISPSRLFRWCHQLRCMPHAVMVSGVPGVGKTTLMQKFVYDWVVGKHYRRCSFVFFFKFRELNRYESKHLSLEKMILDEYPYLKEQLESILKDPDKLLLVFDGLDESIHQIDFRSTTLCSNIKHAKPLDLIVVSLVKQTLLKGCFVLMTSRPSKLALIGMEAFPRVSEIMGFFPKEREIYFNRFFEGTELANKIFQYVKENDTLYTFCYIPSFCWIICTVLFSYFKANDELMLPWPKTVTQLFVTFISNILANHSQDRSDACTLLKSIGWMAEYGVMNHIIIFDDKHLNSFSVDMSSQLLSSFMSEADLPSVIFSFLHLTIQEFFAALVHYIDYSQEKLEKSLMEAKSYVDNRGDLFLRFLCGLSDASTRALLKPYLKELSSETPNVVISWLYRSINEAWKLGEYKDDNRQLLTIFVYLFETRNKTLVLESLGHKSFDFSYVPLTPLDCGVFPFILESCKESRRLNLESCKIQAEGLQRLIPALHTVQDLSLRDNNLKDEGAHLVFSALKHKKCKIQMLCMSSNGLTHECCVHLAPAILNNQSLRTLDLSYNNMEGPYLSELMKALSSPSCSLEELLLNRATLTSASCPQLATAITKSQALKKLVLTDNKLEGPHFCEMIMALSSSECKLEELILSCDGRKLDGSIQLDIAISTNQSLKTLNLAGSCLIGPVFDEVMAALANPACKLKEIILKDCGLTDGSSLQLASALHCNLSLKKLDLSFNYLVGPHFKHLFVALSSPTCRIEDLKLEKVGISDEHVPLLLSLKNNENLTHLDLRRNFIGGTAPDNIKDQLLPNLKELRMRSKQEPFSKRLTPIATSRSTVAIILQDERPKDKRTVYNKINKDFKLVEKIIILILTIMEIQNGDPKYLDP